MATDIELNERLETTWDGSGDLTTVSGANELAQSFRISIIENVDLSVSLNPTDIEEQRAAIEQAVRDNPRSRDPITVTGSTTTEDDGTNVIEYEVSTASANLTILTG